MAAMKVTNFKYMYIHVYSCIFQLYLSGFGSDSTDPEDSARFETEIDSLEAKYTKYGCYCWINGMDDGVIGGGKTKDATDHHCKGTFSNI